MQGHVSRHCLFQLPFVIAKKHGAGKSRGLVVPRSLLLVSTLELLLPAYQERGKDASSELRNFRNQSSQRFWARIMQMHERFDCLHSCNRDPVRQGGAQWRGALQQFER